MAVHSSSAEMRMNGVMVLFLFCGCIVVLSGFGDEAGQCIQLGQSVADFA
jgi:hypothetical protein